MLRVAVKSISPFLSASISVLFVFNLLTQSGWLSIVGWQSGMTLVAYVTSQQFQSILLLNDISYVAQGWHGACFTIAVAAFSIFFNIFLVRRLSFLEGLMLLMHFAGFFMIFVVLWVMGPRDTARNVFTDFDNEAGWSSTALACLVGISQPLVTLIGADSSCHMSEELTNSAWAVPRVMIATAATSYTLAFIMVITFMFNIGDVDPDLQNYGQSYVAVLLNTTSSRAATCALIALVVVCLLACGVNQATASSRQLYAFARDGGMPFSRWLSHVRPGWGIPINAVIGTLIYTSAISLVLIGSGNVFNIMTSLNLSGLILSYLIAIAVIFHRKLTQPSLPRARFSMGRIKGLLINAVALVFLSLAFVFTFFPTAPGRGPGGMNWDIVVMGGVLIFCTVYYFVYGRKTYTAPVEHIRKSD